MYLSKNADLSLSLSVRECVCVCVCVCVCHWAGAARSGFFSPQHLDWKVEHVKYFIFSERGRGSQAVVPSWLLLIIMCDWSLRGTDQPLECRPLTAALEESPLKGSQGSRPPHGAVLGHFGAGSGGVDHLGDEVDGISSSGWSDGISTRHGIVV